MVPSLLQLEPLGNSQIGIHMHIHFFSSPPLCLQRHTLSQPGNSSQEIPDSQSSFSRQLDTFFWGVNLLARASPLLHRLPPSSCMTHKAHFKSILEPSNLLDVSKNTWLQKKIMGFL